MALDRHARYEDLLQVGVVELHPKRLARYQANLVILYIGALCALTVVVVGWTLLDSRQAARRSAYQQASNIGLTLERGIERAVSSLDLSLGAAQKGMLTPGLAAMDPEIRRSILFDGSVAANGVSGLLVADESGTVVYDSLGPTPPAINVADRGYFQRHRGSADLGLFISPPTPSRYTDQWNLPLSRRLNHPDGSFAGVAVGGLRVSYFQSMFRSLDVGQHGSVSLASADGMVIAREPALEQSVGRDVSRLQLFRDLDRKPAGVYEAAGQQDGVQRYYSYRKVGNLPLVVIVGFATQEVFADWYQKAAILGGVLLILLMLGLGLAWALRRELRRRKLAEEAAQSSARQRTEALARLDLFFQNAADALFTVRVEDDRFAYESANPGWEKLTGLTADLVVGQSPQAHLPDHVATTVLAAWRRCVRDRSPVRYTKKMTVPGGDLDWESVVSPVLDDEGRVCLLIGAGRDVSERNRLQASLLQAQRMEAVGQLTTGVAHDFNNLLQALFGALDMLRDEPVLTETGRESLGLAESAARRAATLVHRLLAFSRKQTLDPVLLRPAAVLADVALLLARTVGGRIQVETKIDDDVGLVRVDATQLDSCLLNLALNGRDAMAGTGVLRLSAGNVASKAAEAVGLPPGDYVRFSVEDTGVGMYPETLARAFEPFFTTKEVGKGTGLGLSMVQGFVKQSGGDVRIDSVPDQGTTVSLWLPRAAAVPQAATSLADYHGRGRVLVVDDEPGVRQTISRFLSKAGLSPVSLENAEAALDLLRAGQACDLLVTDQSMPGLSGTELIAEATRLRPTLQMILITGYDIVSGLDRLPASVTVMRKPFDHKAFVRQVQARLGSIGTRVLGGAAEPMTQTGPQVDKE